MSEQGDAVLELAGCRGNDALTVGVDVVDVERVRGLLVTAPTSPDRKSVV